MLIVYCERPCVSNCQNMAAILYSSFAFSCDILMQIKMSFSVLLYPFENPFLNVVEFFRLLPVKAHYRNAEFLR